MGKGSRIDEYRRCAAAGMSKAETARFLGVSDQAVAQAARAHGIAFVSKQGRNESDSSLGNLTRIERRAVIARYREENRDIADDEIEDFRATHEAATRDEALAQIGLGNMLKDFE